MFTDLKMVEISAAYKLEALAAPIDAAPRQSVDRGGQHPQGFEDGKADRRLEGVELELAALGAQRHREIMADDKISDLAHNLRDRRIDLSGHDRGAGLDRRQADFAKTRARAGGKQAQIVANFCKFHGDPLEHAGE